jgi:acid phosphatase (class A)
MNGSCGLGRLLPAALLVMLAGCATRPGDPDSPRHAAALSAMAPSSWNGYLTPDALDVLPLLPPAPRDGDARDEADRRIFRESRAFKDSARWQMAHDDADASPRAMLKDFACSLDLDITPAEASHLVRILERVAVDTARGAGIAKQYYQRPRPFRYLEGPVCLPRESLGNSYDYPSGHATAGWTWGVVLAQVAPAHASAVLARGRAIGDSRVVCGVHNASAVEAARLAASAAMALVSVTSAYRSDLEAARVEYAQLDRAAKTRPDPAACRAEAELVALPVTPRN